jgi:phage terminase large subunit-like protein
MEKRSVWLDRKDFYFDPTAAYNAVRFFESEIYHVKGPKAGTRLKLERWQRRFVRRIYGWKRRDDKTRRYRVAFMFVPRKNGKSLLGAGMALYGLFADNEIGAEVVSAAVDRDQARAIFDVAAQIVRINPRLSKLCTVYTKSILVYHTASKYTVLSADVENKHGLNPSTIVFDELHTQPNGKLVEVLKTGTQARAQPLQVYFTTAGHDRNSVCYDYYLRAKRALSGEVYDPTFLGVVYEVDKEVLKEPEGWKRPEIWRKANPNFGVSVIPNNFMDAFKEACQNKREENSFKRLYLNIWTDTEEVWLDQEQWDACGAEKFDLEEMQGKLCVAGLDLSRKSDFTSLTLVHLTPDGRTCVKAYLWLPKDGPWRKEENVRDQYQAWIDEGCIEVMEGQVIDFDYVINKIDKLGETHRIKEIAYDPTFATELATKLDHKGFKMVEIRQGFNRMSEPSKLLESLLLARTLRHNDHPVLTWMSRHAACDTDSQGNIRPSKGKSRDRIDGIVSLVLALARFIVLKPKKKSRYEDQGLDST